MVHTEDQTTAGGQQVSRRIFRATGALMIIQVVMRGFGIIEKMIIGHFFSAVQSDAYFAARRYAMSAFEFFDQALMHSFLPAFVQRMQEDGEERAWRLASTVINLLMLTVIAITAVGILFAPQVLGVLMSSWFTEGDAANAGDPQLLIQLFRILLVAMLFLCTSSLTYSLLNSYKQFALPASADMALKGAVLIFALLFAKWWGPVALAAGFVVGAVAKISVHATGLRARLAHYRPVVDVKAPGFSQFLLLTVPLLIGDGLSQVRKFFDTGFANDYTQIAAGGLRALEFAKSICDVPVAFFPFAFGIALFPFLADIAAQGDLARLRAMLMTATRMMILIFVPLAVAIIALRLQITQGLFGGGQFTEAAAMETARLLQINAIGMLVGALEIIVLQFYFALSDTLRPTIIGAIMVPLHIAFAYIGVYHLGWGIMAIAAALLFSKGTKVLVLYAVIRRKLGALDVPKLLGMLAKMLLALLPFTLIILAAVYLLPHPGHVEGKIRKLLVLAPYGFATLAAGAAYLGVLRWLHVDEVMLVLQKLRGKMKKSEPTLPPPPYQPTPDETHE
jgi:putative peptidoglycan lipid II flippase